MARVNPHFSKLQAGYLFPEIGRRVREFTKKNPDAALLRLGIGDVVLPLTDTVRDAMHVAVDEMGKLESFRGYGPEQGYEFLRQSICDDYASRGVQVSSSEIFVSDGSKCDSGNIQEIFSLDSRIALTDPVYPVYVDTNVMAGRTGVADKSGRYAGLQYLPMTAENSFSPSLPAEVADIVYLCSPNNPTGTVMTHEELKRWVAWARENDAVILFDAAYEAFVRDDSLPRSIYEVEGARDVAIEFRSFSKSAGFTGTRCAFIVIPDELKAFDSEGNSIAVSSLWSRRHSTKFNGVSYPVQVGAAASLSIAGKKETAERVDYYMENAGILSRGLKDLGMDVYGGENAPYIWFRTPGGQTSWAFFDELLEQCKIVGTPGSGFGASGERYFRLSAFALRENVEEAVRRLAGFR